MLRKALLVGIPVLLVLAVVAAIVVPRLLRDSMVGTKAVGVWQETDSRQAFKLDIRPLPRSQDGIDYTVIYPRSFKVTVPASHSGDRILIHGEGANVVWIATYNEKTDTLTLTRPDGSETHTLKRIHDREALAPAWLLRQARNMAKQGKATQAWWTETTLEHALRAVEPGHWQKPSAKNSRPTYLIMMRGAFTPRSFPARVTPVPVAWGFEIIDPATHLVDESGGTNSPPSTGSLELHEIDLDSLLSH